VPEDTTAIPAKKEALVVPQYAGWNPILDGLAGYGVQPPAARHAAALASDEPEVFDHEPELVFKPEVRHHKEAHASVTYGLASLGSLHRWSGARAPPEALSRSV
jgi:hypothetical protein